MADGVPERWQPAMILNIAAEPTPGTQKAATLLILLGEQASAEILKQLDEEEIQLVSR